MFRATMQWAMARLAPSRIGTIGFAARTLSWGPLVFGTAVALIECVSAQSRELYLKMAGEADFMRIGFGLAGIMMLSAILHAWYYHLLDRRIDEIYPDHARVSLDQRLKGVRNFNALLCASLPSLGLLAGQLLMLWQLQVIRLRIGWSDLELADHLEVVTARLFGLICLTTVAGLLLMVVLYRTRRTTLLGWSWAIGPVALLLPLLPDDTAISLTRLIGPLGVFAIVSIGILALVRAVVIIMRNALATTLVAAVVAVTRWPGARGLLAVAAFAAVVLISALRLGLLDPQRVDRYGLSDVATVTAADPGDASLAKKLSGWLEARGLTKGSLGDHDQAEPYPVFVVAAQGGGIYAASFAMSLLADLQDECPAFARHVFAISAVSGGAIGASIFQGLASDEGNLGCRSTPQPNLADIVKGIATDDHLSLLMLSTPIDWLSKPLDWMRRQASRLVKPLSGGVQTKIRADALRTSFLSSYRARVPASSGDLGAPFDEHWNPRGVRLEPALVLNTTSVETGERVAFAPFSLAGIGQRTLTAFGDLSRSLRMDASSADELSRLRIIDAAVTSARFPGVLPAWPLFHRGAAGYADEDDRVNQLNFVDGGYADSSGASSAADLLDELHRLLVAMELDKRIKLHLILLTDTETTTDLSRAQGNNFTDTLAPVTALLNVRQLLASRAVAQAVSGLRNRNIEVFTLKLDRQIFPLPLGWTLADTSNRLIERLVSGRSSCFERSQPSRALDADPETRPVRLTSFEELVRANSCQRQQIVTLLRRRG